MPHRTRSARRANERRRSLARARQRPLPPKEQRERAAENAAAHAERYPHPPKYRTAVAAYAGEPTPPPAPPRPTPLQSTWVEWAALRWYVYAGPKGVRATGYRLTETGKSGKPGMLRRGEKLVAVERGCSKRAAVARHCPLAAAAESA